MMNSFYLKTVRHTILSHLSNHLDTYPTATNLSYFWGFGSLVGLLLVSQLLTGLFLAMHYEGNTTMAFLSVEHITRDVFGGAVLRYLHANGASMFFLIGYFHVMRGLYYGSYHRPRTILWLTGVILFFVMMATAFLGYVLPWGQMSFWGATVITNLFSAIPEVGRHLVQLLWGGFTVDNPTLVRFYALHFVLPFIIAAVSAMHLVILHDSGSNNPLGIVSTSNRLPFYPYFYVKDLFGFILLVLLFSLFVVYDPNYLGHPDNYVTADALVTPPHIVPEWYFLPFYAILRTIPDKLGGVLMMGISIIILAFLPILDTSAVRSSFFKPVNLFVFWLFAGAAITLGWVGQEIVESPFIEMGAFATLVYFATFLVLLPIGGLLETAAIRENLIYNQKQNQKSNLTKIKTTATTKVDKHSLFFFPMLGNFLFNEFSLEFLANWLLPIQLGILFGIILLVSGFVRGQGSGSLFLALLSTVYLIGLILNLPIIPVIFDQSSHFIFMQESFYILVISLLFYFSIANRFTIINRTETDFGILAIFVLFGALLSFKYNDLIGLTLAIETATLASYTLAGFMRRNRHSTRAGVQYFILGSLPSVCMLLGFGLLYFITGVATLEDLSLINGINFVDISKPVNVSFERMLLTDSDILTSDLAIFNQDSFYWSTYWSFLDSYIYLNSSWVESFGVWATTQNSSFSLVMLYASILIFFNFLFKLTGAPFHGWAPEVYGRAPIAVVMLLSILFKVMIFCISFRILMLVFYPFKYTFSFILTCCGLFSVLVGITGALTEPLIKRYFVYSSMGHVGFMLIAYSLLTIEAVSAAFHYLAVYVFSSFIMWLVLLTLGTNATRLTHLSTLARSNYILALLFAILLFSLGGVPPLGGFFVKLDVLASIIQAGGLSVVIFLVLSTVLSFLYYLRVIKIMFFDQMRLTLSISLFSDSFKLLLISFLFVILVAYMFIVQRAYLLLWSDIFALLY